MDWSDAILLVAVAIIFALYLRLMIKNRRLRQMAELESRLRQNNTVETSDSTYTYMLRITDKCLKGDRMPLDYAKPKIQQLILSGRRVEFLNKEREQMYDAAVVSKKIRFYEE